VPSWLLLLLLQIEAAYDTLFMQSMKRRISGELEVSTSVRYADVPTPKKRGGGSQVRGVGSAVPVAACGAAACSRSAVGPKRVWHRSVFTPPVTVAACSVRVLGRRPSCRACREEAFH